ncbi:MAG TPA: lysine biosynthesis protein LysW [Actinomycetota bacterium]|nr:lysine biosynthesis protein LysW [Actinomycetota bacterium]
MCPECGSNVGVQDGTRFGEVVTCGECGVELEVIQTAPLQLALAPEVEEDWGE